MHTHPTLKPLLIREKMIRDIRMFFEKHHFHEMIVPVLNPAVPLEPTLFPFSTTWSTLEGEQKMYLSTSPERYLKKMLAFGLGNCYAIGHTFRNVERSGPYHHPEFLMLEWYREHANFNQIMDDVEQLVRFVAHTNTIRYQGQAYAIRQSFPRLSLEKLFMEHVGVSFPEILTDKKMQAYAKKLGYAIKGATWEQLFHQIMLNEVEPHFPKEPFFLLDFPARISPLCACNTAKPYLADRFEFFIAGIEIGNGNTEETSRERVQKGFEEEFKNRIASHKLTTPIDEEFLKSVDALVGQSFAGIGLGIDRLAMILADVTDIHLISGN